MSEDSKLVYEEAYAAHYEEKNADRARRLYRTIISRFPDSDESRYAQTQLQNLEENPPQPSPASTNSDSTASGERAASSSSSTREPAGRAFPTLELISSLFELLALLNVLGCVGIGIYLGGAGIVVGILFGAFSGTSCWAISESILVLLAIEKNTRATARAAREVE